MIPVVTVVASAIILGERLTWISLAGILLTLCGVTISEYRKNTEKRKEKAILRKIRFLPPGSLYFSPLHGDGQKPLPEHVRPMISRNGQTFIYHVAEKPVSGLDIRQQQSFLKKSSQLPETFLSASS